MEGYVKTTTIKEGLPEIEFFHPKHNSLPSPLLKQLATAITEAGEDDNVQVIILKSGGNRTFCAGASFDELISIQDHDTGKAFFMGFANVINAIRKCPKLIIGKVQGKAVGGGVGDSSGFGCSPCALSSVVAFPQTAHVHYRRSTPFHGALLPA